MELKMILQAIIMPSGHMVSLVPVGFVGVINITGPVKSRNISESLDPARLVRKRKPKDQFSEIRYLRS